MSDLVRPQDAARQLGVQVKTLARWERDGKISAIRTPGGQRRYRAAEILALQENPAAVPAPPIQRETRHQVAPAPAPIERRPTLQDVPLERLQVQDEPERLAEWEAENNRRRVARLVEGGTWRARVRTWARADVRELREDVERALTAEVDHHWNEQDVRQRVDEILDDD